MHDRSFLLDTFERWLKDYGIFSDNDERPLSCCGVSVIPALPMIVVTYQLTCSMPTLASYELLSYRLDCMQDWFIGCTYHVADV